MSAEAGAAADGGSDEHVRRVRLPADRRTPAAARALVRSVLTEADLDGLVNEALLLTTELSTNAVEHAGTDLDIEVVADDVGLTVTVSDFASGPVDELIVGVRNDTTEINEVSERGRGLLLVDHFASRWGTTYLPTGKGVWFRLERADRPRSGRNRPEAPSAAPRATTSDGSTPSAAAMSELMQTMPDPYSDDPLPEFATDLLGRVGEMIGAAGGMVHLDRGDGQGSQVLARYGRHPRSGQDLLRVPLAVHRPYVGQLELDAAPSGYARPLAVLAAERLSLHLENDRLRRADVRRRAWLTFLAEASELLAHSLDVELTMALIPQLVVPRLGQWCAVHTTDEWGRLKLAAASHADESVLPQLHQVLRETGPESIQARLKEATRNGSQVPLSAPTEGFAVPLIARGQRLGTLAVGRHQRHRHDPDEVAV
ncbi:ATP-binding protein, partial [Micromonospora sp. NPDC000207]|uniref:ATP-binding protein n=1 Tax=Micromonospora sp. NPDC000207 TaxID=3154246 RepID=UPI00332491B3